MPSEHHRHVVLAVLALCAMGLSLAACSVNVSSGGDYYLDGSHTELSLRVKADQGATLQSVQASVNGGDWQDLTLLAQKWRFHPEQSAKALKVAYQVAYRSGGADKVAKLPDQGAYLVPVLGQDADSDADGTPDRTDSCVYQADPVFCRLSSNDQPHFRIDQTSGTGGVTMKDNTGNLMLSQGQKKYFAFKFLESSVMPVTAIKGINGLSSASRTIEVSDCKLVYQDPAGGWNGWFVQVFAADGNHPCQFTIKQDGHDLLQGSEVLIMVRTAVGAANVTPGHAEMYGRVTLVPGSGTSEDAQAIYKALTGNQPVPYVYFWNNGLSTLADIPQGLSAATVHGTFGGTSYVIFPPAASP